MISIIIPTYNRKEFCIRTVKAIVSLDLSVNYEIIVVDDGSKDSSYDFSYTNKVKLIINKKNSGRSISRNNGAKVSKGDILFFIDDDIIIKEDIFEKHVKEYEKDSIVKAIVSNTQNINGENLTKVSSLNQYLNTRGMNKFNDYSNIPGNYLVTQICSIEREMFEKINGFNEGFDLYGWEDPEIGLKIERNKGALIFIKAKFVYHLHDKSISLWLEQLEKSGKNFVSIIEAFPEFRERFGYSLFNSIRGRFIFNPFFYLLAKFLVEILPNKIPFVLLQYLFYATTYKAYIQEKVKV